MALRRVARCICVALLPAAAACAPGADDASISVSPASVDLAPRMTFTFTADVDGTFGDAATWELTGPALTAGHPERLGTIANGVYVAPDELPPPGQDVVTVIARSDVSEASASATIQLIPVPMDPRSGVSAGGTRVTLTGPEIGPGTTVSFDGILAIDAEITGTQIEVTAPAHAIGPVDVEVAGPGGTRRYPLAFHYEATALRLGPGVMVSRTCSGASINPPAVGPVIGGDALADIVFSCEGYESPSSQAFLQNLGGVFEHARESPTAGHATVVADFDGDALADVMSFGLAGIEGSSIAWGTGPGETGEFEPVVLDTSLEGAPILNFYASRHGASRPASGASDVVLMDAATGILVTATYDSASGAFRPVIAGVADGPVTGEGWLVDVDGDALLDGIVVRDSEGTIEILRRGFPTLSIPSGTPAGIAAGNLVGTAATDLAVRVDGAVHVLEGPSFTEVATVTGDVYIGSHAVGDVDGDGTDDLLTSETRVLRLHPGLAPGLIGPPQLVGLPGAMEPHGISFADLDGAAPVDLLLQDFGAMLALRGRTTQGGPFWGPERVVVTTSSVLAVTIREMPSGASEAILGACTLGSGSMCAILQRPFTDGAAISETSASDISTLVELSAPHLDDDVVRDIAFICAQPLQTSVCTMRGLPDGTLSALELHDIPGNAFAYAVGDVDEDGRPDLVVTGNEGVHLLRGGPDGFGLATTIDGEAYGAVTLADIDGDEHLDLIAGEATLDRPVLFSGNGQGGFDALATLDAFEGLRHLRVTDLDADFRPDLVIMTTSFLAPSGLHVLRGLGDFVFDDAEPYSFAANGDGLDLVDLDRDGELDAVSMDDAPTILASRGGFRLFESPRRFSADLGRGAVGHVDGDGIPDLIVVSQIDEVTYLEILRNESFSKRAASPRRRCPRALRARPAPAAAA